MLFFVFVVRPSPFEKKLQAGKQTAFEALKYRAVQRGEDAIAVACFD
jgi:hypothetical protein